MTDIRRLLESFGVVLGRLAWPAEDQVQYLTDLGVAESLDELALEFDDLYRPLAPVLNSLPSGPQLLAECQKIDTALISDTLGWRFDDLNSEEWASIRLLATRANELVGLSLGGSVP